MWTGGKQYLTVTIKTLHYKNLILSSNIRKNPPPTPLAGNPVNTMHKHRTQEPCEQSTVTPTPNKLTVSYRTQTLMPIIALTINKPGPQARCPKHQPDRVRSQYGKIRGAKKLKFLQ